MDAVVPHRVDHLVHEALGRDVRELQRRVVLQHVVPDGVHQVRLAEPHAAVDEQRVVDRDGASATARAGRVRELVRRSDDEGLERVAGVETGAPGNRCRRRLIDLRQLVRRECRYRQGALELALCQERDGRRAMAEVRKCLCNDARVMLG